MPALGEGYVLSAPCSQCYAQVPGGDLCAIRRSGSCFRVREADFRFRPLGTSKNMYHCQFPSPTTMPAQSRALSKAKVLFCLVSAASVKPSPTVPCGNLSATTD